MDLITYGNDDYDDDDDDDDDDVFQLTADAENKVQKSRDIVEEILASKYSEELVANCLSTV